jgi:hypothetical protein
LVSFFLSQSQAIRAQASPSVQQFSSILESIQIQIERGNLTRASHLLKLLLERNPPRELRPLLRAITGNLALRQGNLSKAIAIYDELLLESFQGNENRLTWLNNYVKALREREKIYLIQAKEDMETKENFLSLARADREKARHLTRKAFKLLETGKTEAEIRTRLNLIELNDERGNRARLERDILSLPLYATKVEFLLELAAQSREPLPLLQEAVAVAQKLDYPHW